jgi:hypothetical protein
MKGQRPNLVLAVVATLPTLALAGACQELNTPLYFKGPDLVAGGGEDPPVMSGLSLRFRDPTDRERDELQMQAERLGYGMDVPWVSRDKVHVELLYKVTNDSGEEGTFNVLVDGATEYTKYDFQIVSDAIAMGDPDEAVFFPLMQTMPRILGAGASFSGILREDDFNEGALDIDALGRWLDTDPSSPTFAGVLINDSDVNPVGLNMVPPNLVVPMFIEVNVSLQTNVAMTCEYVVRVRDDDDRLLHNDADTLYQTSPTLFQPAAM